MAGRRLAVGPNLQWLAVGANGPPLGQSVCLTTCAKGAPSGLVDEPKGPLGGTKTDAWRHQKGSTNAPTLSSPRLAPVWVEAPELSGCKFRPPSIGRPGVKLGTARECGGASGAATKWRM